MVNPKEAEKFYINNSKDGLSEYDYESIDALSSSLDGIRELVEMAKQGKIDPWNIDITEIADKYMLHIIENSADNLRISSRAWLFLAVLLKLKSNVLAGIDVMFPAESAEENVSEFETDSLEDYDAEEKIDYFGSKVIPINEIIQRRTSVKQNRTRTVTLKDLIRQLEFYEHLDRKEGLKKRLEQAKRKVTPFNNMPLKDIVNLAQEDYIEPAVKLLQKRLTDIFEKETKIELNALAVLGLDKVTAYTALLFLSAKNGCDLEQEEFYSSVYVIKCTEENRQIISEKHQEAANGLEITD